MRHKLAAASKSPKHIYLCLFFIVIFEARITSQRSPQKVLNALQGFL